LAVLNDKNGRPNQALQRTGAPWRLTQERLTLRLWPLTRVTSPAAQEAPPTLRAPRRFVLEWRRPLNAESLGRGERDVSELTGLEVAILNEVGCEEPWSFIAEALGSDPSKRSSLVRAMISLESRGLLAIVSNGSAPAANEAALISDAENNSWYQDLDLASESPWSLRVTQEGFRALSESGRSAWV
jgi:hypothetical protein